MNLISNRQISCFSSRVKPARMYAVLNTAEHIGGQAVADNQNLFLFWMAYLIEDEVKVSRFRLDRTHLFGNKDFFDKSVDG